MLILFISISVLLVAIIFIQSKYLILIDNPHGQSHKSIYNKNTPLSGGIFFFIILSISIFFTELTKNSFLISLFLLAILMLGIFSDLKSNFSPKLRLCLQFFLVFLFVFLIDLKINRTGVFFLDYYIDDKIFNLIFTTLCITILINGSNFCDGVNCNVVGYYIVILIAVLLSNFQTASFLPDTKLILISFFIFYISNLFQKSFLGDNGTYVISLFMSLFIISFININENISPLLALNLLWYPAFENLFTIVRRLNVNKKVYVADELHFHTLLKSKVSNLNKNLKISNSLTGLILNLIMSIGIFISMKYYNDSKLLLTILLSNIIIYILIYFLFLSKKSKTEAL